MALLCSVSATTRFASIHLSASSFVNKSAKKRQAYSQRRVSGGLKVQAFFKPFEDQLIIKDAIKEPVAFVGGMFAGLLRLDLDEDPLKEWIAKTIEASGIKPEELVDEVESTVDGKEDSLRI